MTGFGCSLWGSVLLVDQGASEGDLLPTPSFFVTFFMDDPYATGRTGVLEQFYSKCGNYM